jgi:hypothetical protein
MSQLRDANDTADALVAVEKRDSRRSTGFERAMRVSRQHLAYRIAGLCQIPMT